MQLNRLTTFLSIGLLAIGAVSCDKFLDKTDKDLLIPETVEQYRQILRGDAYSSDYQKKFNWVHYMDDDIEIHLTSLTKEPTSNVEAFKAVFQWKKDLEDFPLSSDNSYGTLYKHILACNVIINAKEMSGTQSDRNLLLAQAYTLRAYYYFMLVNLYAKPYNASTASTDPGISLWLDSKPTLERLSRSTIAETYELINEDIDSALALFKTSDKPNNTFEISEEAALLLASRVALYQEDYDKVISRGSQLLQMKNLLYNITASGITFGRDVYSFISQRDNPEILFNFGDVQAAYSYIYSISTNNLGPFFQVSQRSKNNLIDLYSNNDVRLKAFFVSSTNLPYLPVKYSRTPSLGKFEAWRVAEVYLNMAEAYARQSSPDANQALSLINELRRNRLTDNVDWTAADFSNNEELVAAIWEERRRELCFEEIHRWWDLRRQGMPELEHIVYYKGGGSERYLLQKGDPNYTLEIPRAEREYNPGIQLNNRVEKNPEN